MPVVTILRSAKTTKGIEVRTVIKHVTKRHSQAVAEHAHRPRDSRDYEHMRGSSA